MNIFILNVAKMFTTTPGYSTRNFGPYSGEEFREDVLLPSLREHDVVVVKLDGCYGFCPSFLEEAFGRLDETDATRVKIESLEDPSLIDEIYTILNRF